MAITFNDREYRLSHGKAPRGRGTWAFLPSSALPAYRSNNCYGYADQIMVVCNDHTLTEAKAVIRERLAAKGLTNCSVEVLP